MLLLRSIVIALVEVLHVTRLRWGTVQRQFVDSSRFRILIIRLNEDGYGRDALEFDEAQNNVVLSFHLFLRQSNLLRRCIRLGVVEGKIPLIDEESEDLGRLREGGGGGDDFERMEIYRLHRGNGE